jgi:tRNA (guanine-N7-)-methyltransferase
MQLNSPTNLAPWFTTLKEHEQPLEWRGLFGNDNPVELDVGCGRGLFLVNASQAHPEINYVGIEIDYREGRRTARRLKKRMQPNARVLGGDAREALGKYVPPASIAAVHVYFPDPWWKRKHWKRRLITDEFIDLVVRVLEPGALFHHWTDVEDYFKVVEGLLDHDSRFQRLPDPPEKAPAHDMDYLTSFERKKRQAGLTIWRGCWKLAACDENTG